MISKSIAQFTTDLKYGNLPDNVISMCKVAIIDWLGSVLAGSQQPPAQKIAKIIIESGSNPESTVIGFGKKSSAMGAALINGAAAHTLEMDDLHRSSIMHPAAPIISAAVSIAEKEKVSGKDLICAVVAGYEVGIRVAEAVTPSHYYFWHTTGTCGTFGATIAASKLCNLTEEEIVYALGNAGSQAAGLWEFIYDGAMSKHLHPGKSAMNGIIAALLAREGFTGATKIIEGEKGFFKATATDYDLEKVTKDLNNKFKILGNSYKIYPSCRHTHGGVDLALDFANKGIAPEDIERITINTYSIAKDLVNNNEPKTSYEAKFSLQFCVASALINKRLGLNSFDEVYIKDPAIKELMSKCYIEVDPQIDRLYPEQWPTEMEVQLRNGKKIKLKTEFPKGDPENPASAEELKNKFMELATICWSTNKAENILNQIETLESANDVTGMFE